MHFPYFRGRSLEGGDGGVWIDNEDTDEAIEGGGGGDVGKGVGGKWEDVEVVAGVGGLQNEVVGVLEQDSHSVRFLHRF